MITAYDRPSSLDEVLELRQRRKDATIVAGATDLGVRVRRQLAMPNRLLDVSRVPELRRLDRNGDGWVVGAAVTHRELEGYGDFAGALRALPEACSTVGSIQTRNVGTIGGNLCNASPGADTPPVLLAFDAEVELAGPAGRRRMPVADFLVGYRATVLARDEVLVAIHLPRPPSGTGSAFEKLGRRRAMEISVVCVAARLSLAPDGTVADATVALGSVSATSVRAARVEQGLLGAVPEDSVVADAARCVVDEIAPIDDVRASARYRRRVAPVLVARAIRRAVARARQTER